MWRRRQRAESLPQVGWCANIEATAITPAPRPFVAPFSLLGAEVVMHAKLILMLSVILGSLVIGYLARKLGLAPVSLSPRITRTTMTWVQPVLVALLIWGLEAPGWRTALLPVLAATLMLVMWPVGAGIARLQGLARPQAGSMVASCMFSNLGLTFGAFICYVLLGEQGAALGMIWCIAFMPMLFGVGFVVARLYGGEAQQSLRHTVRDILRDPASRNPLLGFAVGGVLHLLAPERPPVGAQVVDLLVPLSTGIYLFAIGLSLRLTSVVTYWRECLTIGSVKFVLTPVAGLALAWLVGYAAMEDRALLQVVFIQSATPTAIMGLVLAQIFDLDEQLANAAWLTTNIAGVALAPLVLQIAAML